MQMLALFTEQHEFVEIDFLNVSGLNDPDNQQDFQALYEPDEFNNCCVMYERAMMEE